MRPLSAFKFFSQNRQKMVTVITILVVAVISVSFITSLVTTIFEDGKKTNLATFSHFSFVAATNDELYLSDKVLQDLRGMKDVEYTVDAELGYVRYTSLLGSSSVPIVTIANPEDLKRVFDRCGLILKDGRFPNETAECEIIVHTSIIKNKNLSINDYIGKEVDDKEILPGKFKIVGSFSGDAILGFSNLSYSMKQLKNAGVTYEGPTGILLIPRTDDALKNMNEGISEYGSHHDKITITTFDTLEEMFDKELQSMMSLMTLIILVIVCAMAISTGALLYVVYIGRMEEFCILHAIGYSKGFIYKLIFKEITALSSFGWLIGYAVSLGLMKLVEIWILEPNGQSFAYFDIIGFVYTLIIPVMISICSVVPVLKKLHKVDLISVIEKRG